MKLSEISKAQCEAKELYRLASLVGTDARNPEEKLSEYVLSSHVAIIEGLIAWASTPTPHSKGPLTISGSSEETLIAYLKGELNLIKNI